MDRYDLNTLTNQVQSAVRAAINGYVEEQEAAEAKDLRENATARKRGKVDMDHGWTDNFAVVVDRFGSIYGKNARVMGRRDDASYEVYPNAHTSVNGVAKQWRVRKQWFEPDGRFQDAVLWDLDSDDFEENIKTCIRLVLADQGLNL